MKSSHKKNLFSLLGNYFGIQDIVIAICAIVIGSYLVWHQDFAQASSKLDEGELRQRANIIEGYAKVSDGDSIIINRERIRIVGIDAPELHQKCYEDNQAISCGIMSKEYMTKLISHRMVRCRWIERDKYKRILGQCMAGKTDLNRQMVEDGWAVSYSGYPAEERQARQEKLGIWKWKFANPKKWRRQHPRYN